MKQSRPQSERKGSGAAILGRGPGRVGVPSAGRSRRRTARRGVRRLQAQDQFLPLLVAATLLTTITLVLIAYLTVRADALAWQQQQVTRDARLAEQMLAGPGEAFALKEGQLVAFSVNGQGTPAALAAQLARVHTLTGDRAALYTMQARGLVAVASAGLGAVGQPADAMAAATVVGDCGQMAAASCYHTFAGTLQLRDGSYSAAVVPLFDPAGAFVGALAVAQPESAMLAPAAQFTIVLLFVGLLVTLVVLAVGVWTCNLLAGEVLDALHLRLNHLATIAAELERAARQQVAAARRQERMARQVTDGARDIDALVNTMTQGHLSMHDSATGVWAEMSQPGIAPDPAAAMRFARQAVVMAARVGVAAEDARTRCNAVVRLMNQVIAEGHVLSGHGHETERRAAELRGVVEQVERALGEPLAAGPSVPAVPSRLELVATLQRVEAGSEDAQSDLLARPWRHWSMVLLYARLAARRLGRALVERAAELAGRTRERSSPNPLAPFSAYGEGGTRAAGTSTSGDGQTRPSGVTTRPSLGIVRPDEWYPQEDVPRRESRYRSDRPGLPELPRHPDHPQWRGYPGDRDDRDNGGDAGDVGRDQNDTRPRR